jgi:hypothetical protein
MCAKALAVLACLIAFAQTSAATVSAEQRWAPFAKLGMDNDAIAGLVDADGNVWQGGWFTYIDDARSPSVAFHDGSGWRPAGAGLNARVTAFALRPSDGAVIAAGAFTHSGTERVRGLARWTGSTWVEFAGGLRTAAGSPVTDVTDLTFDPSTGALYVAGTFEVAGVDVSGGIARYSDTDGWSLLPQPSGLSVWKLAWDANRGRLVAGGSISGGAAGSGVAAFRAGVWSAISSPTMSRLSVADVEVGPGGGVFVAADGAGTSVFRIGADDALQPLDVEGPISALAGDASAGTLWACCGRPLGNAGGLGLVSWDGNTLRTYTHPERDWLVGAHSIAAGRGRTALSFTAEETIGNTYIAGVSEQTGDGWRSLASSRAPRLGGVIWSEALNGPVALGDTRVLIRKADRWESLELPMLGWRPGAVSETAEGFAVSGVTGEGVLFAARWDGTRWVDSRVIEELTAQEVTAVVWQPQRRRYLVAGNLARNDADGSSHYALVALSDAGWGHFGRGLEFGGVEGLAYPRGFALDTGGALWVYGRFDSAQGQAATGLARVDGEALVPMTGFPLSDLMALAASGGVLFASDTTGKVHRLSPGGTAQLVGEAGGQFRYVGSLVFDPESDTLLASGDFDTMGALPVLNIARYRNGVWATFRGGVSDGPVSMSWKPGPRILSVLGDSGAIYGVIRAPGARTSINRPPAVQAPTSLPAAVFVGDTITPRLASVNDADGDSLDASNAWYRDGQAIPGATSATYVATRADRQRSIVLATRFFDGEDAIEVRSNTLQVVNRRPSTSPDRIRLDEGAMVELPQSAVLANDVDRDGDPLAARVVSAPSGGAFTIQQGGTLRVGGLPAGRFEARYAACDDLDLCSEETLVLAVRSRLIAYDDTISVSGRRGTVSIATLANDRFEPQRLAAGSLSIESPPASGSASIDTRGTTDASDDRIAYAWTATPASGIDAIRYRVCETEGRCSSAIATVVHAPVADGSLVHEAATDGGWRELELPGLQGMQDIRVEAHGLVAPTVREIAVPLDETPADAMDAGSARDLFLEVERWPDSERRRVFIDAVASTAAVLQIDVGADLDADGVADASERACRAVGSAGRARCDLALAPVNGSLPFFWVRVRNLDGDDVMVRLDVFDVPVDLPAERRSVVATSGTSGDAAGALRARLSWSDPTFLPGQSRGGWLSASSPGQATVWQAFRWSRRSGDPSAFALRSGIEHRLALGVGGAHERLYIDVPPGTARLDATAFSTTNVDLYLARVEAPTASGVTPTVPAAPARGLAQASGQTVANEILSIDRPAPGRWYVTPVNAGSFGAEVVVSATLTGTGPQLRPGGFFNPQRSGNGLFLYPAGSEWAGLWYTYLQDGTPTWYYLQAPVPGATGVWRGTIYRSAWNGSSNFLTPVGEATVTPRSTSAFTFSYTLDGETGSEAYENFGGGCPTFAGAPLNASGHWFDPARAGSGFSVQLFPNYEFYTVFGYDAQGVPRYLVAERSGIGPATDSLTLAQNTGACPLCNRTGNPVRNTVGTLTRTVGSGTLQRIQLTGTYTAGVAGTWAANDAVTPLGSLQGCAAN